MLQVVAGNGVRLVGNAARRMARRAAKWLCVRGILKTNRRNRPICFQEVTEYQQDRRPANAAACGGLADGECRYRDAVFFRRHGPALSPARRETAAARKRPQRARRDGGETARTGGKRRKRAGNGENGRGNGERRNGEGKGYKKTKRQRVLPFCGPCRA